MSTKIAAEAIVRWNNGPSGPDTIKSGWMRGYDLPPDYTRSRYSHVSGYDGTSETYEDLGASPWVGNGTWSEVWHIQQDQDLVREGRLGTVPDTVHSLATRFEHVPEPSSPWRMNVTVPHNEGGWKPGQFADIHLSWGYELGPGGTRVLEYDWHVRGAGGVGLTHALRMEAIPIPTTDWINVNTVEDTITCPDSLTVGSRHGVILSDFVGAGLYRLVSYVVSMPGLFDRYSQPSFIT